MAEQNFPTEIDDDVTTSEYDKSMFPDDLHEMNLGKYQQPLNRYVFKRQRFQGQIQDFP